MQMGTEHIYHVNGSGLLMDPNLELGSHYGSELHQIANLAKCKDPYPIPLKISTPCEALLEGRQSTKTGKLVS